MKLSEQKPVGQQLLTEKQVAELLQISLSKLRSDRHFCKGFRYVKIGRSIRYHYRDILDSIDNSTIDPLGI